MFSTPFYKSFISPEHAELAYFFGLTQYHIIVSELMKTKESILPPHACTCLSIYVSTSSDRSIQLQKKTCGFGSIIVSYNRVHVVFLLCLIGYIPTVTNMAPQIAIYITNLPLLPLLLATDLLSSLTLMLSIKPIHKETSLANVSSNTCSRPVFITTRIFLSHVGSKNHS